MACWRNSANALEEIRQKVMSLMKSKEHRHISDISEWLSTCPLSLAAAKHTKHTCVMSHEGGVVACNQLKASLSDSHLLLFLSEQYLWRRFTILTGESVAAVFHEGLFEDSSSCMCSMLCGKAQKREGSAVQN